MYSEVTKQFATSPDAFMARETSVKSNFKDQSMVSICTQDYQLTEAHSPM